MGTSGETGTSIQIRPITLAIGAEVTGVDLRQPLTDTDVACLRRALLDHLVLFFRDQDVDDDQQLEFALRFGPMHVSPLQTVHQDAPEIVVLDQIHPVGEGADEWHSDNTFLADPPMGSILRAVQLPDLGGDTCFASMYAAYEALSPAMRALVDGLRAVHDITRPLQKAIRDGHSSLDVAEMQEKCPPVEHNVVVTHPETGRRALFLNRNSTTHLVGLTDRENDVLLPFLFDHVRSPEFQCRFHWEQASIAFWDNRAVQHYAVADYRERRVMHRATIAGPVAR
jgi:taurine dioxygenase